MKSNQKLFFILLLSVPWLSGVRAQESTNGTGGNATGSGGSVSYSVGQFFYHTYSGTNGSVAEGVQQPFEISVITAIEGTHGINVSVLAFPVPAQGFLTLSIKNFDISNASFQLFDLSGKLLRDEKITGNETRIDLSALVPSIYILKVIQNRQEIKTFRIIKN